MKGNGRMNEQYLYPQNLKSQAKEEFERAREYYQKKTNATMVFIYKEREEPKTT